MVKQMFQALQAPGLERLEYTNSCQLARPPPEWPGQMLPSVQGARVHVDMGLGWRMVTQLPSSIGTALLTRPIPSHSKSSHLGPFVPCQGTQKLGPGVPGANKGLWAW